MVSAALISVELSLMPDHGKKRVSEGMHQSKGHPKWDLYRAGLHLRSTRIRTLSASPSISAPLNLWKKKKRTSHLWKNKKCGFTAFGWTAVCTNIRKEKKSRGWRWRQYCEETSLFSYQWRRNHHFWNSMVKSKGIKYSTPSSGVNSRVILTTRIPSQNRAKEIHWNKCFPLPLLHFRTGCNGKTTSITGRRGTGSNPCRSCLY